MAWRWIKQIAVIFEAFQKYKIGISKVQNKVVRQKLPMSHAQPAVFFLWKWISMLRILQDQQIKLGIHSQCLEMTLCPTRMLTRLWLYRAQNWNWKFLPEGTQQVCRNMILPLRYSEYFVGWPSYLWLSGLERREKFNAASWQQFWPCDCLVQKATCKWEGPGEISPFSHIMPLVSKSAANPMLSFVMTRFSMSCDPSAVVMASWLNSTKCSLIRENLQHQQFRQHHIKRAKYGTAEHWPESTCWSSATGVSDGDTPSVFPSFPPLTEEGLHFAFHLTGLTMQKDLQGAMPVIPSCHHLEFKGHGVRQIKKAQCGSGFVSRPAQGHKVRDKSVSTSHVEQTSHLVCTKSDRSFTAKFLTQKVGPIHCKRNI